MQNAFKSNYKCIANICCSTLTWCNISNWVNVVAVFFPSALLLFIILCACFIYNLLWITFTNRVQINKLLWFHSVQNRFVMSADTELSCRWCCCICEWILVENYSNVISCTVVNHACICITKNAMELNGTIKLNEIIDCLNKFSHSSSLFLCYYRPWFVWIFVLKCKNKSNQTSLSKHANVLLSGWNMSYYSNPGWTFSVKMNEIQWE